MAFCDSIWVSKTVWRRRDLSYSFFLAKDGHQQVPNLVSRTIVEAIPGCFWRKLHRYIVVAKTLVFRASQIRSLSSNVFTDSVAFVECLHRFDGFRRMSNVFVEYLPEALQNIAVGSSIDGPTLGNKFLMHDIADVGKINSNNNERKRWVCFWLSYDSVEPSSVAEMDSFIVTMAALSQDCTCGANSRYQWWSSTWRVGHQRCADGDLDRLRCDVFDKIADHSIRVMIKRQTSQLVK